MKRINVTDLVLDVRKIQNLSDNISKARERGSVRFAELLSGDLDHVNQEYAELKAEANRILKTEQPRAIIRNVTADDLISAVERAERVLHAVPKCHRKGAKIVIRPGAGHFPNAYDYPAAGSEAVIRLTSSGWVCDTVARLDDVRRMRDYSLIITEDTRDVLFRADHREVEVR